MLLLNIAAFVLTWLALQWYKRDQKRRKYGPLPPSPPGGRLISGHAHAFKGRVAWEAMNDMLNQCGYPVFSFRVFNKTIIMLNDYQSVSDLLEAKASLYSDRPYTWMIGHLIGRKNALFDMSTDHPNFKISRRLLAGSLNSRCVTKYMDVQRDERRKMLQRIAATPEAYVAHLQRNSLASILMVAYGWRLEDENDRFAKYMEEGFRIAVEARRPGKWLVEVIPLLRFVPSWFPGAGFKRIALVWRKRMVELENATHNWAKEQIASGNYIESFTSLHMQPEDGHVVDRNEEEVVLKLSYALYAAGYETILSSTLSFLAHILYLPEVKKRAQEEVDKVLGKSRLPTSEDMPHLPYLTAVVKEVMRCTPAAPTPFPHLTKRDDTYHGYHIPAGVGIMVNIWAILHDEKLYPDPMTFNPERHLGDKPQLDPRKVAFGFGRRVCPGAHYAEVSILLNVATLLAVFDIEKPVDEHGKEIEQKIEFVTYLTTRPAPFKCRFVPRPHAEALLQD